ncbi:hypothetical protein HYT84_04890 [Candidatus Micrarchaeota archaeon]|nr:hypothetical protein [Candidatus Micrarchaeota archaeon]
MIKNIKIFNEPTLEFRYGQISENPHDGLALFGPFDADSADSPKRINYGLLGTEEGIAAFKNWVLFMTKPILPKKEVNGKEPNKRLWPLFPGFEVAFNCALSEKPAWSVELEKDTLIKASRYNDSNKRTYFVAGEFIKAISTIDKRQGDCKVIICIVPDEVWKNCRPNSVPEDSWGNRVLKKYRVAMAEGQETLNPEIDPLVYKLSTDFRRQLKARVMKYKVPIQIIRESTLEPYPDKKEKQRGLTPAQDRAWNISTTLYYKAGGKPWRLATAREGVSYIGITFKKAELSKNNKTACCAAQMFLDSGDGVVFLGEKGPWYSPEDRQFRLSKKAAKELIKGVLKNYRELDGKPLKEIFIHSRSEISEEEFEAYKEACPEGTKVIGIRIRSEYRGFRLYRPGKKPIIRGTFFKINEKSGYLWGSGFKPKLGTYDGWEVPVPLKIDIQHGEAGIEEVAKDILGLTKLNYNACKLGDSEPVTILFSNAVGEILVSNPGIKDTEWRFSYYI